MTIPPISEDPDVNATYDQIRRALTKLFDHSPEEAYRILAAYYQKYPRYNEDFYVREGPYNAALLAHYDIVLQKSTTEPAFFKWRTQYDPRALSDLVTIPPISVAPEVNDLYDQIRRALTKLFGHSPEEAYRIFATYHLKHPSHDEDYYFHESPYGVALRAHYDVVLQKDTTDLEFFDWRNQFDPKVLRER